MSSQSRNSPVDNEERRGAAEGHESEFTEGQGTPTAQGGATAGNGGFSRRLTRPRPLAVAMVATASPCLEDRAGIVDGDRADDPGSVSAREGSQQRLAERPHRAPEGRRRPGATVPPVPATRQTTSSC